MQTTPTTTHNELTMTTITIPAVTDAAIAFGTTDGLPKYETVPEEFKQSNETKWNDLFNKIFFGHWGNKKLTGFKPKEGVNPELAWRHIQALLRSWESKHEHKEAGVSYLMSQYFDDFILEDKT